MSERKVAVITAGGSGMGAAIAEELARRDYAVAILSSSGKGEALAKRLGGIGVTGSNLVPADLARVVDGAIERFGRIDALINSAGHAPKGELLAIADDDWHLGLDMMLLNVVRACRLVTPQMERQGKGAIVNISTYAAFEPELYFPLSGPFRAALAAFVKLYADRYAAGASASTTSCPASSTACPKKSSSSAASRWGATARWPRSPARRLFWSPTTPATSPGRTCASTAASRARCDAPSPTAGLFDPGASQPSPPGGGRGQGEGGRCRA